MQSGNELEPLLSLAEAAESLGYKPSGLRKIVARTKRGKGNGPHIQFFQVGRGPIRFKREWIENFIAANSVLPGRRAPSRQRKRKTTSGVRISYDWSTVA